MTWGSGTRRNSGGKPLARSSISIWILIINTEQSHYGLFFFFPESHPPSLGLTLALSELGPTEKILTSCYIPATQNRHHFWTWWALQQTSPKFFLCMIPLHVCTPFLSVSLNHFPIPIHLYNILKKSISQEETFPLLYKWGPCVKETHTSSTPCLMRWSKLFTEAMILGLLFTNAPSPSCFPDWCSCLKDSCI